MSRRSRAIAGSTGVLAGLAPHLAWAHGFATGGALPSWIGLDHALAMLAVGAWAAQRGGRSLVGVPAVFVGAVVVAGALGALGIGGALLEPVIAGSVLALGLAIAACVRLPERAAAFASGLVGLAHGCALGLPLPHAAQPWSDAAAACVTAIALVVAGAAVALLALERDEGRDRLRMAGVALALVGLWLSSALV